jgi:membrane protease YdiL (CAAX protease family)
LADRAPRRNNVSLLLETLTVAIVAIGAVRIIVTSPVNGLAWFLAPGVLVGAALIPTIARKGDFAQMDLTTRHIGPSLFVLCATCAVVFPVMFLCMWMLKSWGWGLPLRPAPLQGQSWLAWLLYQFMYVAVAEEVFFRGYVQTNILKLTYALKRRAWKLRGPTTILLSAACFAVAHVVVQGQVVSAVTFLPGLLLAWLFIRTKSLVAPILFHGLANTAYCMMAAALA